MSLRTKNLNLVPLLQALLEEGSVVDAARRMNLSQPAMSGALARLRDLLDDPLLVRNGRRMQLTPRAQMLKGNVTRLCTEIEGLFEPAIFDPATASAHFVIATPDYIGYLLTKALLPRLAKEAPGVTLRFVDVPIDLVDWLRNGDFDLAVCGNFGTWPELDYEPLFADEVVAIVWNEHPLAKRNTVSVKKLLEYPTIDFRPGNAELKPEDRLPTGIAGLDLEPQVTICQITDAILLTVETSLVTAGPKSLADALCRLLPVKQIKISDNAARIDTGVFYLKDMARTAALAWLRQIIEESLASFRR